MNDFKVNNLTPWIKLSDATKEINMYKKAFELACNDIADSHPILKSLGFDYYEEYYLRKAREQT